MNKNSTSIREKFNHEDMRVDPEGMAFMLKNMSDDAGPEQYIRELTQNAIEAGAEKILWTIDPDLNQSKKGKQTKLSLIDNGKGMTGAEMVHYLNQLSASSGEQSQTGNFGIGAKITAGVKNPHGLVFVSWKNGVGSKVHLWQNPENGRFGLKKLKRSDGSMGEWTDIIDTPKPRNIIGDHGTKVILLGENAEDNTAKPPSKSSFTGKQWVSRYLSSRYTKLPEGVEIRVSTAASNNFKSGELVYDRARYFHENSIHRGTLKLEGVDAHWWLLNDIPPNTPLENKGHVGVSFQGELYDIRTNRSAHSLIRQAGIVTGGHRVVIYFNPKETNGQLIKAHTSRGGLLIDNQRPPMSDWVAEFSENLPNALKEYADAQLELEPEDRTKKLKARLEGLRPLFKSSAFQPDENGQIDIENPPIGLQGLNAKGSSNNDTGGEAGIDHSLGSLLRKTVDKGPNSRKGKEAKGLVLPNPSWVSSLGDSELEDRAAKFDKKSNKLIINSDFRGFIDLVKHIETQFPKNPRNSKLVKAATEEYYAQVLMQAVIGVQGLSKNGAQISAEYDALLTPDSLTTAVMVRAEIYDNVMQDMRKNGVKPLPPKPAVESYGLERE